MVMGDPVPRRQVVAGVTCLYRSAAGPLRQKKGPVRSLFKALNVLEETSKKNRRTRSFGSSPKNLRVQFTQCIWIEPEALPLPARAGGQHRPQT